VNPRWLTIRWVVGNASVNNPQHCLEEPLRVAKKLKAEGEDVLIVAMSRDRLIRHAGFDGTAATERPTSAEYKLLAARMDGIPLATIMHPDDPDTRGAQTQRGQAAKGKRGGRPRGPSLKPGGLKERQILLLPQVLYLHAEGKSYRVIGTETGIPWTTVRRWINAVEPGPE
jgi:hypothetical protein